MNNSKKSNKQESDNGNTEDAERILSNLAMATKLLQGIVAKTQILHQIRVEK